MDLHHQLCGSYIDDADNFFPQELKHEKWLTNFSLRSVAKRWRQMGTTTGKTEKDYKKEGDFTNKQKGATPVNSCHWQSIKKKEAFVFYSIDDTWVCFSSSNEAFCVLRFVHFLFFWEVPVLLKRTKKPFVDTISTPKFFSAGSLKWTLLQKKKRKQIFSFGLSRWGWLNFCCLKKVAFLTSSLVTSSCFLCKKVEATEILFAFCFFYSNAVNCWSFFQKRVFG